MGIDIDDLGYGDLPNNDTKYVAPGGAQAAQAVAGDQNQPAQQGPAQGGGDAGSITGQQISTKMSKVLNSLHVSADDRRRAMDDSKKGFNQSFSKNSRTLAALGFAYLKAIDAE